MTEVALAGLAAIGRFIRRDSPERAESFVEEIQLKCMQLGAMPRAFRWYRDTRIAASGAGRSATI